MYFQEMNNYYLIVLPFILHSSLFVETKLYVTQAENLIIPFLNQPQNCHVYLIQADVLLYFSNDLLKNTSWLTTFTLRNMLTLDSSGIPNQNESIKLDIRDIGLNDMLLALKSSDTNIQADPQITVNPLNWKRNFVSCFIVLIFVQDEYQISNHQTKDFEKPEVYFPYLTAIQEAISFFSIPQVLQFEPYISSVVHVSMEPSSGQRLNSGSTKFSVSLNDKLRSDLHLFVEYMHPVTWILNFHKSESNEYKIVPLSDDQSISFFSTSCTSIGVKRKFKLWNNAEITGATITVPFKQLNNISSECSHPNVWSLENDDYTTNLNLEDYQKLSNIFILPLTNKPLFRFALISVLLDASNNTLAFPQKQQNYWLSLKSIFPKIYPERRYSQEYTEEFIFIPGLQTHRFMSIPVRKFGYNFLTCYSYEYQSWRFYLEPFQIELWIVLAIYLTMFAVGIHVTLVLRRQNKSDFNAFIYAYSTILEYPFGVPEYVFKVNTLKLLIGLWLLLSVIFTNAYKGIAITGVTSPHAKSSLRWFYDLLNYDIGSDETMLESANNKPVDYLIYSSISNEMLNDWKNRNSSTNFELRSDGNLNVRESTWLPFYYENMKAATRASYDLLLRKTNSTYEYTSLRKFKLIIELGNSDLYAIPAPDYEGVYYDNYLVAVEREITNCSRKAIYVDDENKINTDLDYLSRHYQDKTFFKGNESLFREFLTWQFDNPRGSPLTKLYRQFLENGIYFQLEWFYNRQEYSGERLLYTRSNANSKFNYVKALDIYSNIQTIFYVYLSGMAFTISAFILEHLKRYLPNLKRVSFRIFLLLRSTYRRLKKCVWNKVYGLADVNIDITEQHKLHKSYAETLRSLCLKLVNMFPKYCK